MYLIFIVVIFWCGKPLYKIVPPEENLMIKLCKCIGVRRLSQSNLKMQNYTFSERRKTQNKNRNSEERPLVGLFIRKVWNRAGGRNQSCTESFVYVSTNSPVLGVIRAIWEHVGVSSSSNEWKHRILHHTSRSNASGRNVRVFGLYTVFPVHRLPNF